MRITLVAVGRAKTDATTALYRDFAKRLKWPLRLHEVEERNPLPPKARKKREGERLIAAVPGDARVVALDERGKSLDSPAFAALLGRWQDEGLGDLALSFGQLTWPHLLVRVLLAEQLFRAQCILDGHPYHRG